MNKTLVLVCIWLGGALLLSGCVIMTRKTFKAYADLQHQLGILEGMMNCLGKDAR